MSTRYIVRAPDRSGQGHDALWTPGRRWPGGKEVEVEVLDQDEDPTVTERVDPSGEEKRTFPHPTQIGRLAWARIASDKLLTVRPVGDVPAEAVTLQADLATTKAQLADAIEKVTSNDVRASLAEREVVKLGEALTAATAELEIATSRAESAESASARLTEERDELSKQLEQLTAPSSTGDAPTEAAPANKGKGSSKRGG